MSDKNLDFRMQAFTIGERLIDIKLQSWFRDKMEELAHWQVDTQDKLVREKLIQLGWTPPTPESDKVHVDDDFEYWEHFREMHNQAKLLNKALRLFLRSSKLTGTQQEDVEEALFAGICKDCLRTDLKENQRCHCTNDE